MRGAHFSFNIGINPKTRSRAPAPETCSTFRRLSPFALDISPGGKSEIILELFLIFFFEFFVMLQSSIFNLPSSTCNPQYSIFYFRSSIFPSPICNLQSSILSSQIWASRLATHQFKTFGASKQSNKQSSRQASCTLARRQQASKQESRQDFAPRCCQAIDFSIRWADEMSRWDAQRRWEDEMSRRDAHTRWSSSIFNLQSSILNLQCSIFHLQSSVFSL